MLEPVVSLLEQAGDRLQDRSGGVHAGVAAGRERTAEVSSRTDKTTKNWATLRPAIVAPLDRVAAYVGVEGGFDGFLEHVLELRTSLDVPHSLGELGVDGSRVDEIVAGAVDDPSAAGNPVPFTEAFARSVLADALNGTLRSPV